jgi:hypothetical protein
MSAHTFLFRGKIVRMSVSCGFSRRRRPPEAFGHAHPAPSPARPANQETLAALDHVLPGPSSRTEPHRTSRARAARVEHERMSKKNSKKRWNNQHQESMRREREEAAAKAARAAKREEKVLETLGVMGVDGGDGLVEAKAVGKLKTRAGKPKVRDAQAPSKLLKVSKTALVKKTGGAGKTKNSRKIIKNVPVGKVQTKLKLRKGATIRGIKVTNSDSRNKILNELKAEAAMAMTE